MAPTHVTVVNVNRPPAWDPMDETLQSLEGEPVTFDVSAHDPDQDTLGITALPMPYGASFADHGDGTGRLTWTPDLDQAGAYQMLFTVNDGLKDAVHVLTIFVRGASLAISGRVVSDLGAPLPGYAVSAMQGGMAVQTVQTGADGRYLLSGLEPGEYAVKVTGQPKAAASLGTVGGATSYSFAPRQVELVLQEEDEQGVEFVGTAR
jgi:hypothetical protein